MNGLRRSEGGKRGQIAFLGADPRFGGYKLNPILDWDDAKLEAYLTEYNVLSIRSTLRVTQASAAPAAPRRSSQAKIPARDDGGTFEPKTGMALATAASTSPMEAASNRCQRLEPVQSPAGSIASIFTS